MLLALSMALVLLPLRAASADVTDGYYLIGSINGWSVSGLNDGYKFSINPDNTSEYKLAAYLNADDELKVVRVENGSIAEWYPGGDNYVVDSDHAGPATIYFKPEYQSDWAQFGGFMWVQHEDGIEVRLNKPNHVAACYLDKYAVQSGETVYLTLVPEDGYMFTGFTGYCPATRVGQYRWEITVSYSITVKPNVNPVAGFYYSETPVNVADYTPQDRFVEKNSAYGEYERETTLVEGAELDLVYIRGEGTNWSWSPHSYEIGSTPTVSASEAGHAKIFLTRTERDGYTEYFRRTEWINGVKTIVEQVWYTIRTYVAVHTATDGHGSVTAPADAFPGDTGTFTTTPDAGYIVDTVTVTDAGGNTIDAPYGYFTMPESEVTISVTFTQGSALQDGFYLVPANDVRIAAIDPDNKLALEPANNVFDSNYMYTKTANFGTNTYRIVKVENGAIVPFENDIHIVAETTGVTETIYLGMSNATYPDEWWSGVCSLSGYYLNIGWTPFAQMTADWAFTETDEPGIWMLAQSLYSTGIYVVELENGRYVKRYPDINFMNPEAMYQLPGERYGWGVEYTPTHVYFRPDGLGDQSKGWYYGYFVDRILRTLTIEDTVHGTVTADKGAIVEECDSVVLTVAPDPGSTLASLVVTYTDVYGNTQTITPVQDANDPTKYTFEMPLYDAVVTATFTEPALPEFKTQGLLLSGEIGVKFFMKLPAIDGVDYADSYMTFSISGIGSITPRDDFDPNDMNGAHTYYAFTCYVNSLQMADTITATFHYGDGQTVEKEYRVKDYFTSFDASLIQNPNAFNAKTQAMIRATADFGHYVQAYLADQKGLELGTDYAEMDKYYAASYDADAVRAAVADHAITRETNANVTKVTYSLILDSATKLCVYFKTASRYSGEFTVTVDGAPYTATYSGGRYTVEIDDIPAHELSDQHTIVVTTDAGQITVTVSCLSYVQGVLEAYTEGLAVNAACAIYAYAAAADAMLN
jgi:hypothetical protein